MEKGEGGGGLVLEWDYGNHKLVGWGYSLVSFFSFFIFHGLLKGGLDE